MKMGYKKQIKILVWFSITCLLVTIGTMFWKEFNNDTSLISCVRRLIFSNSYQNVFLLSFSLLITLIPLYFLKEAVYKTWRKFVVVYLPIAIVLIAFTKPTGGAAMFAFDREMATITFSALFLIVSFFIITIRSFRLRGK